jgi:hypothetical protein
MGDGADDQCEYLERQHVDKKRKDVLSLSQETWTTANGQVLKLCDMSSSHLSNCIKLIGKTKLSMENELKKRIQKNQN